MQVSPQDTSGSDTKNIQLSFADFKTQFGDAAKKRFGSGWAWLMLGFSKALKIGSTPNQDNPLMDVSEIKGTPLLGLDVWEHAYYLKYQNKSPDYIEAWWKVVNWDAVAKRYVYGRWLGCCSFQFCRFLVWNILNFLPSLDSPSQTWCPFDSPIPSNQLPEKQPEDTEMDRLCGHPAVLH